MVKNKTPVSVTASIDSYGHMKPTSFICEGISFKVCRIEKEHYFPTERDVLAENRVFYCMTDHGSVHLYYLAGKWFVWRGIR